MPLKEDYKTYMHRTATSSLPYIQRKPWDYYVAILPPGIRPAECLHADFLWLRVKETTTIEKIMAKHYARTGRDSIFMDDKILLRPEQKIEDLKCLSLGVFAWWEIERPRKGENWWQPRSRMLIEEEENLRIAESSTSSAARRPDTYKSPAKIKELVTELQRKMEAENKASMGKPWKSAAAMELKKIEEAGIAGSSAQVPSVGRFGIPQGAHNCLAGLKFIFTGLLNTITIYEGMQFVKRHGGKVTEAPSSGTSYAVLGRHPSNVGKIQELKIKTIDEQGLFALLRSRPTPGRQDIPKDATASSLSGLSFVFTGLLSTLTRDESIELVKRYGGNVTRVPRNETSYAVVGRDPGCSKLRKIKELKIIIIDEEALFALIHESNARTSENQVPGEEAFKNHQLKQASELAQKEKSKQQETLNKQKRERAAIKESSERTEREAEIEDKVRTALAATQRRVDRLKEIYPTSEIKAERSYGDQFLILQCSDCSEKFSVGPKSGGGLHYSVEDLDNFTDHLKSREHSDKVFERLRKMRVKEAKQKKVDVEIAKDNENEYDRAQAIEMLASLRKTYPLCNFVIKKEYGVPRVHCRDCPPYKLYNLNPESADYDKNVKALKQHVNSEDHKQRFGEKKRKREERFEDHGMEEDAHGDEKRAVKRIASGDSGYSSISDVI